jgi:UrcA family protein
LVTNVSKNKWCHLLNEGIMKKSKLVTSFLATIIFVALGAPAVASVGSESIKVSYADLNLEEEDGALSLYRRLKQASKQACDYRGPNVAGSVNRMMETRQCYLSALSAAVERVDNEMVTKLHSS